MRTIIFAILFSVLTVSSVRAETYTGNDWLTDCEKGNNSTGLCLGKIVDWNMFYEQVKDCGKNCGLEKMDDNYNSFMKTCMPQGVTHLQVERILIKWLNHHPEQLHEFMYRLYGTILLETFPCTKNTTP